MNCPNCNETLVMADRQGVEIDYCPKCRGVWLDRGELDKIIERASDYTGPSNPGNDYSYPYPPQQQQQGGYYKDPYYKNDPNYKGKKRKGFFGDFFDFD